MAWCLCQGLSSLVPVVPVMSSLVPVPVNAVVVREGLLAFLVVVEMALVLLLVVAVVVVMVLLGLMVVVVVEVVVKRRFYR